MRHRRGLKQRKQEKTEKILGVKIPIDELAATRTLFPSSMNFVTEATSSEPPNSRKNKV